MIRNLIVLSLFDGGSIAREALKEVEGVNVLRYYSSEVDKFAIRVANFNHPQDEKYRLGDVTKINPIEILKEIEKDFKGINYELLLIGGSPCQGFSMVGKRKGSSTTCGIDVVTLEQYLSLKDEDFEFNGQSFLFWEYIRIKNALKPKYFLLENVVVSKKWYSMFNTAMGVNGVDINSRIVSAQNRPRSYWSNLKFNDALNKNIKFSDILEDLPFEKEYLPFMLGKYGGKTRLEKGLMPLTTDDKCRCLTVGSAHPGKYLINLSVKKFRMLTAVECERLQTLRDGYTECVSNTQRHKILGNWFTKEIISIFLRSIIKDNLKHTCNNNINLFNMEDL